MQLSNSDHIDFLSSVLPFISKYKGSIIVVKYGGAAMNNLTNIKSVIRDILFLYYLGIKPIIVHGGGPSISRWLNKLNIESKFSNGLRITNSTVMEVVQMVLAGQVNKQLVTLFNTEQSIAVGLSGSDACLIHAKPLFDMPDNYIGQVDFINNSILKVLLDSHYIPIIASIGMDDKGQVYNINADTVAGAIASSIEANKLVLLTDALGIMTDINDVSTLLKELNFNQIIQLKNHHIISGGMIPKVDSCLDSLVHGVSQAHIIDGRIQNALLYELFTVDRIGSMITL